MGFKIDMSKLTCWVRGLVVLIFSFSMDGALKPTPIGLHLLTPYSNDLISFYFDSFIIHIEFTYLLTHVYEQWGLN